MKNLMRFPRLLAVLCLLLPASLLSQSMPGDHALGLRLGFSGGPNSISYRKVFGSNIAWEGYFGYSPKEGRRIEPFYRKGNWLAGFSLMPFVEMSDGWTSVGFYAYGGARVRYHDYRPFSYWRLGLPKISLDGYVGGGMQVAFSESFHLFADLGVKYYNNVYGYWIWGVESGLGLRFTLN